MFGRRSHLVLPAAALAAAALTAGFSPAPSPAAGGSAPARPSAARHVVQPGDTLWGIAGKAYPDEDPRAAVDRIASANDLSGASLMPGEVLVLP